MCHKDAAGNITKKTSLQQISTQPIHHLSPTTSSQSKTVTFTLRTYNTEEETEKDDCSLADDTLFINTATGNTFTLNLESDNGNYICVKATDEAGNITKDASTSTIEGIDTTESIIFGALRNSEYQITITTNEDLQTVASTSLTSGGGFTFTNDDGTTTLQPTHIEIANNKTILTFDSSGTALTKTGTYVYAKPTTAIIKNVAGIDIESFDSANAKEFTAFSINFDRTSSGSDRGYTSNEGLFLYLKTQNAYNPSTNTLTGLIKSPSLLAIAEANVVAAIAGPQGSFLDLDGVGGYTSNEGLFLYLKTQKAYTPGTNTFTGFV